MKKIGWIGTGVMGHAMVQHIIKAGYEVSVCNRTKSKTDDLVKIGAKYVPSVAELSRSTDIVFSIIGDPQSVEETYFGEKGIIENLKVGSVVIDMTTTKPSLAQKIYTQTKQKGCVALDAPVSGGDVGAINGKLSIMAGGDKAVYSDMKELFKLMGNPTYCGEAGYGQHTKMANQIGIAGNTIAICEAMVYAEKAGLDIEKTIQVVSGGAAGSWGWQNLAPRITRGELDTCFFIKHFVKDLRIALEECDRMSLKLPGLSLVHELYTRLIEEGDENLGTQALIKVIKKMNNM